MYENKTQCLFEMSNLTFIAVAPIGGHAFKLDSQQPILTVAAEEINTYLISFRESQFYLIFFILHTILSLNL